ncbi:hypothetical protein DFQ27_009250 [Actinomortierella ambigua]|uniref:Protein Zds1 C-terminal domain-containing protein n=1 Tax=Actinomortierella ambigua TaxID=1343610 RepID=A0A9P6UAS0_9FUNG|nr:hypothetical protein DFQ27_009250 [Actinomortierella ambigua]
MRSRKREIIALDGFMFDSSVLKDTDGQDDASDCSTGSNNNITPGTASTPSDRQEPSRTLSKGSRSGSSQESSLRALHRNNAAEALAGNTRPTAAASAAATSAFVSGAPTPLTISGLHNNSDSNSNDNSTTNGSQAQPLVSPSAWTVSYSVVVVEDSQDDDRMSGGQRGAAEELRHKTLSTSSVSSTSSSTDDSSSASSPTDCQTSPILEDDGSPSPFMSGAPSSLPSAQHAATMPSLSVTSPTSPTDAAASAALALASSSSTRQSIFVGDPSFGIDMATDLTTTSSSSNLDNAGVDQDDMKEVQIETEDPSHLFWIAPNEYNKWLVKHGVQDGPDGLLSTTRRASVRRRKSVLSSQYNPEDDQEEPAEERRRPEATIREKTLEEAKEAQQQQQEGAHTLAALLEVKEDDKHDFLSGVFKSPLEQMGEPPLKKMTSLRRSVSLSVQSPTRDDFPVNVVEEDLVQVKRVGLGGQSLLRRSARTKIRRNSTASNDTRVDASRLRPVLSEGSEYQAVSLVDPGFIPLPSANVEGDDDPISPVSSQEQETKPLRRFVSTLRDASKPTITTYVEPQLLEQQRKDEAAEEASKAGSAVETNNTKVTSPYRANASGQLESPISTSIQPTPELLTSTSTSSSLSSSLSTSRKEAPIAQGRKIDPVGYPIPPPVKLPQNLLQRAPSTGQSSPQASKATKPGKYQGSTPTGPSHSKKPSTWSWLWGKEKEKEKANDRTNQQQQQQQQSAEVQQQTIVSSKSTHIMASAEDTQTTTPVDSVAKGTASSSSSGAASGATTTATAAATSTTTTTSTSSATAGATTGAKKQSTFSMLFSRGTKSSNNQAQSGSSTATDSTSAVTANGSSGQSVHGVTPSSASSSSPFAKPKYTNYNRLPIHIERAIYRLSHVKLANPRRPLQEQVLISNMMFWYLGVIQQQQMLQQQQQQELQQQQQQMQQVAAEQLRASGHGDSKSGKDGSNSNSKSKTKTKKRKSQKKKNGQRGGSGGSSKAEVVFKSPQYDVQQQEIISQQYSSQAAYHQQQLQQQQHHQQKSAHQYYNQQSAQQQQQGTASGGTVRASDEHGQPVEATPYDEESLVGGGGNKGGYSDSMEEPEEDHTVPDSTGNMMSGRSVNVYGGMATTTILGHDNDDDVPLAHYQHVQRQGVPVS